MNEEPSGRGAATHPGHTALWSDVHGFYDRLLRQSRHTACIVIVSVVRTQYFLSVAPLARRSSQRVVGYTVPYRTTLLTVHTGHHHITATSRRVGPRARGADGTGRLGSPRAGGPRSLPGSAALVGRGDARAGVVGRVAGLRADELGGAAVGAGPARTRGSRGPWQPRRPSNARTERSKVARGGRGSCARRARSLAQLSAGDLVASK